MRLLWKTKSICTVVTFIACSLYISDCCKKPDDPQCEGSESPPPDTFPASVQKIFASAVGVTESENAFFKYLKSKAKLTSKSSINLLLKTLREIDSEAIQNLLIEPIPEEVIVPFRIQYTNSVWKDKQLPLIVFQPHGQLGNVMGEYATVYALRRIYNASVMLIPHVKDDLSKSFPCLSITETVSAEEINDTSLWYTLGKEGGDFMYGTFELAAAGLFGPKLFSLQGYGFEIQLFNLFYEDIKKEFAFSTKLRRQAAMFLDSVRKKVDIDNRDISYVGFHVRRTSYVHHVKFLFKGKLPGDTFFQLALDYYRRKLEHPVFIVASDDTAFVEKSIIGKQSDVYISKGKSATEDLALLASCNHSIITWGTYGFWGGYLAGGEVVYPVDTSQETPYRMNDRLLEELNLPNFTPIKY